MRYYVLILVVLSACSTTKISTYPSKVGHQLHDQLWITYIDDFTDDSQNEMLNSWAVEKVQKELPSIVAINHWDGVYSMKKGGLAIKDFNHIDSALLEIVNNKVKIRYILICKLDNVLPKEILLQNNPRHNETEATLSYQLIDSKFKGIVWSGKTRTIISPLLYSSGTDNKSYGSINPMENSYAINKAYKKSFKKLIKALDFYFQPQ